MPADATASFILLTLIGWGAAALVGERGVLADRLVQAVVLGAVAIPKAPPATL